MMYQPGSVMKYSIRALASSPPSSSPATCTSGPPGTTRLSEATRSRPLWVSITASTPADASKRKRALPPGASSASSRSPKPTTAAPWNSRTSRRSSNRACDRWMKVAISARFTGWSGQKRSGAVPQPAVTPEARNASMERAWTLPASTSLNPAAASGTSRSKARSRNVAISARVTTRSGQNRSGSVLQPAVTPNSAKRSIWAATEACRPSTSTSAKREESTGCGPAPARARPSHTAITARVTPSPGQNRPPPQ